MTMETDILDLRATLFGPLKTRLAKADRSELELTRLRLFLAGSIAAYAAWHTALSGSSAGTLSLFAAAYLAAAILIFLAILAWPRPSVLRRLVGIVIDVSALTWGLWVMGEAGVVLVGLYLFVILGNGLRYGRKYLRVAQALSIVGFASVMMLAPWWHEHFLVGAGLLQILIVFPLYVAILAQRLIDALRTTEQALAECRGQFVGTEPSSEAATES
jgi:two-component system, sensor histidine kinase RpfC